MTRLQLRAALITSSLAVFAACANLPNPPPPDPVRAAKAERSRQSWFQTVFSTDPELTRGGQGDQAAAFVGREDLIVLEQPSNGGPAVCDALSGNPIAAIVERARATNIVVINEAHDAPRDRYFIGQLLEALKPEGYTIYAAETFEGGVPEPPNVYLTDGFYVAEPMFGRLIQLAGRLGYRLVGFEQMPGQGEVGPNASSRERIDAREQAQANNLMTAIFRDHPDEKVVIHVGYQHAQERSNPGASVWMAERLAKAAGRDPLTVNQVDCLSSSPSTAVVTGRSAKYDFFIGHPRLALEDGRPAWRQAIGDKPTTVPATLTSNSANTIIEARPAGVATDLVPTDRLLLRPGEKLPLLLPPGRYRLDAFTPAGPLNAAPVYITVRATSENKGRRS